MKAVLRYRRKLTLIHKTTFKVAIAELRVFKVPKSEHYPEGLKFSMFCVLKKSGQVIVGFDNHRPKGPHLHLRDVEIEYKFYDLKKLVQDFWKLVKKEGYNL